MNVESDSPDSPHPVDPAPAPTIQEEIHPKPWGFWMTIFFTVLILLAFMAVQSVVVIVHLVTTEAPQGITLEERLDLATKNGDVLSLSAILGAAVLPIFCVLFAWLKRGIRVRDYLALRPVSAFTLASWLGMAVGLAASLDFGAWLAGHKVVPDVMIEFYNSVSYKPLIWLAVIIGAPISEEFIFRGFTFAGLRESWLGTYGTIVVTSVVWAGIHLQYNLAGILSIFVAGLLLGVARARSESLLVPIAMHAIHNLIAMLELAYVVHNNNVAGPV
jgi:uncharacterized protein